MGKGKKGIHMVKGKKGEGNGKRAVVDAVKHSAAATTTTPAANPFKGTFERTWWRNLGSINVDLSFTPVDDLAMGGDVGNLAAIPPVEGGVAGEIEHQG